jgi:hypothetical protein
MFKGCIMRDRNWKPKAVRWVLGWVALSTVLLAGCGGGSGSEPVDLHPDDKSGCLNRYDAIQASMGESQLGALLGEATYKTYDGPAKDGKLLGMGWEGKVYDNQLKCSFLIGMDKKGAYSKGVTGEGFAARSELLRSYAPY